MGQRRIAAKRFNSNLTSFAPHAAKET